MKFLTSVRQDERKIRNDSMCQKPVHVHVVCIWRVRESELKKKIRYTQKKLERKAWAKPTQMTYICTIICYVNTFGKNLDEKNNERKKNK